MKETTSKRKGGWFWVGVILLTFLLSIFVPMIVAEPSIFIIIFAMVLLAVPVGTIIYGVKRSMKAPVTVDKVRVVSTVNEEILVVIETKERKTLYFTSNRVILAKYGGQGLLPESILTAHKKNFAIPYTEIHKVELLKKEIWIGLGLSLSYLGFGRRVRITATAKKHEFRLRKGQELDYYANTLRPVLADKLVVS